MISSSLFLHHPALSWFCMLALIFLTVIVWGFLSRYQLFSSADLTSQWHVDTPSPSAYHRCGLVLVYLCFLLEPPSISLLDLDIKSEIRYRL